MALKLKIKSILKKVGIRSSRDIENEKLIASSELFDAHWYRHQNPDVKVDPLKHFLYLGGFEGRHPSPDFDIVYYLNSNADVKISSINPLVHYLSYGIAEERPIQKVDSIDEMPSPRDLSMSFNESVDLLSKSELFQASWYVQQYDIDVASDKEATEHFLNIGWKAGYDPSPSFSTEYYLTCNSEIIKPEVNPLVHYLVVGKSEKLPCSSSNLAKYNLIGDLVSQRGADFELARTNAINSAKRNHLRLQHGELFEGAFEQLLKRAITIELKYLVDFFTESLSIERFTQCAQNLDYLHWYSEKTAGLQLLNTIYWKGNNLCAHLRAELKENEEIHFAFFQQLSKSRVACIGAGQLSNEKNLSILELYTSSLYRPIFFVSYDKEEEVKSAAVFPFPTLFRNGLHYAEILHTSKHREAEACEITKVIDYSYVLVKDLMAVKSFTKGERNICVLIDEGTIGVEEVFKRPFLSWLGDFFKIELYANYQTDDKNTEYSKREHFSVLLNECSEIERSFNLTLHSSAIPTLKFLCSPTTDKFGFSYILFDPSHEKFYLLKNNPIRDIETNNGGLTTNADQFPAYIEYQKDLDVNCAKILKPVSHYKPLPRKLEKEKLAALLVVGEGSESYLVDTVLSLVGQEQVIVDEYVILYETRIPDKISNIMSNGLTFSFVKFDQQTGAEKLKNIIHRLAVDKLVYVGAPVLLHDTRTIATILNEMRQNNNVISGSCISVKYVVKGKKQEEKLHPNFYYASKKMGGELGLINSSALINKAIGSAIKVDFITPEFLIFEKSLCQSFCNNLDNRSELNWSVIQLLFSETQRGFQNIVTGKVSYFLNNKEYSTDMSITRSRLALLEQGINKISLEELI